MSDIVVIKRSGKEVKFDSERIRKAIIKAMYDTKFGVDEDLAKEITQKVYDALIAEGYVHNVDNINDKVEIALMESPRKDVAKEFIKYRWKRDQNRGKKELNQELALLTEDFLSKYKHLTPPMTNLGMFTYYRTYSRWNKEEKRREYWWETVRRAVEYNCSLDPNMTTKEAEELYDNVFNLKQFLSGRTFWVGGTEVTRRYPTANFNCAFKIINKFEAFKDIFYLLMIGAGIGVRVLKEDVKQLPRIRTNVKLMNLAYKPLEKDKRIDCTSLHFDKDIVQIIIGDSKDGWAQALEYYFKILYNNEYRDIKTIIMDYNNVRPKGEELKTFGGRASGHESLKVMFEKIHDIITIKADERAKLKTIDCLDIANIIGQNVVVGGVRRTAEMVIVDSDDEEVINAKNDLYIQVDGEWKPNEKILHRQMSNNSIWFTEKPTRDRLKNVLTSIRYSGEPGFINYEAAKKRKPNVNGINPCAEILLDNNGLCNLTTVNCMGFVSEDGTFDKKGLLRAQELSARAGYRMTTEELELPEWDYVQSRDRLVGCSITGWQDMVNKLELTKEEQENLLTEMRLSAHKGAKELDCKILQKNNSDLELVTTVKPEGTLTLLPTVSSGVHYSHSPYYVRRIRINSSDPLASAAKELGYPIFPEVGQNMETCDTYVIEFPVKAPVGKTKGDVTAIEQLEIYKMFLKSYVDHNCSITVHVRDHEWVEIEEWIWENWDDFVAVSFISHSDNFYNLLPFEEISEEEYLERSSKMAPFVPSILNKYDLKR